MEKKYAMLLDLDKCIGCYTCVIACKMSYGTKVGVDYNAVKPVEWGEYPDAKQRFVLTMCMHCENPSCEEICPSGATYKTPEGAVLVDYDKCIGCGYCIAACPYGQRHLVEDEPVAFQGAVMPWEEESASRVNVAEKCLLCAGRVSAGSDPACTVHCPGQCRVFGDINDPTSKIAVQVIERNARKIDGTSIYYVLPQGMNEEFLPKPFKRPAFMDVEKVTGTASKAVLGAAVAAVAVSAAVNIAKGGKDE